MMKNIMETFRRNVINEVRGSTERLGESLTSSLFLKVRESAELDILSYFSMPSAEDLGKSSQMHQRQMPESKRPELWELRNYLIYGPSSKKTSGFDYDRFSKEPVPEDQARKLSTKVGLDYDWIMKSTSSPTRDQHNKDKWPLQGIDLTNYMVYWMVDNGTLIYQGNKLAPTPAGAKRFHELLGTKQRDLPDTIQGGDEARWDPPKKRERGRGLDLSRWKQT